MFDIAGHRDTTESPSTTTNLVVGIVDDHPAEVSRGTTGLLEEVERVNALEVVHDAYKPGDQSVDNRLSAVTTYRRGKQPASSRSRR